MELKLLSLAGNENVLSSQLAPLLVDHDPCIITFRTFKKMRISSALHPMQPAVDSGLHQVDQPKLARYSCLHWQPPQPQPQAELHE
ncbi:hypothetical protein JCM18909_1755 [Cutibacterium acnes JCM 18909]|nr:hypothetical protein JCM18909_1755 [Cutibacterium acnes JCM 18909]